MDVVTAVSSPELEKEHKSDAVLCQRASFTSMTSTRYLTFARTGVIHIFGINKHTRAFINHTCGVFLHTAVLYPPNSEQFTSVLFQNKRNIAQNSQMAQYDRRLCEGLLDTFCALLGWPKKPCASWCSQSKGFQTASIPL